MKNRIPRLALVGELGMWQQAQAAEATADPGGVTIHTCVISRAGKGAPWPMQASAA